jgi:hypothetical protein
VASENESQQLQEVLRRIAIYCKQRGIDMLTTMEQYDKHQMGEITESQFYRAFVGPTVTEAEMTLLRDKYSDPGKAGLINYLNFVQDLNILARAQNVVSNDPPVNLSATAPFVGVEEKVNGVITRSWQ